MNILKESYSHSTMTWDGHELKYTTNFEKYDPAIPTLFFNYGLVCSLHHWRFQAPFFEKLNYQIIFHDYRCHYGNAPTALLDTCNFQNIAKDMDSILKHQGMVKPVLIGHSMGVNVCLEFAKMYPENTGSLILISGTVFPPQDVMFGNQTLYYLEGIGKWGKSKFPKVVDYIWKNSYHNPLAVIGIRNGGFNPKRVPKEFVSYYMKKISELSIELFFQLLDEMERQSIIKDLPTINCPTLIIGGEKDQVVPNHIQYFIQKEMPHSNLHIIKNGSHVPQADFPEIINDTIHHFLVKELKIDEIQ
jgi:non-heme chloroperoxidase